MTPAEVAGAIARYGTVGTVRDIVPKRLGVSGRVVELEVVGAKGQLDLKGLQVRWGLGLRENLFVINRETGPRGDVERFVITGKGWGHGVGMCQVGAFGMALVMRHASVGMRHLSGDRRDAGRSVPSPTAVPVAPRSTRAAGRAGRGDEPAESR